MDSYQDILRQIQLEPRTWLITGVAGFIGSNLLETLLRHDQQVVGLDNFETGFQRNLDLVRQAVSPEQWGKFKFHYADIRDLEACRAAAAGVDYVLHQAALGSVGRSLDDPLSTNATNVGGFLNMLVASRDAGVRRFVYAASSASYGDHPGLPKKEALIGRALSPYAVSKLVNELYADVFGRCYGMETIGLRYFNVFGPRQNPDGAYAAVIPKWFAALLRHEVVLINGDGETSRDFCYVANAVQANILAATSTRAESLNQVYNVAVGERTTLNALFGMIRARVAQVLPAVQAAQPCYCAFRDGDVRHSLADIGKICELLAYRPTHTLAAGLDLVAAFYIQRLARAQGWRAPAPRRLVREA